MQQLLTNKNHEGFPKSNFPIASREGENSLE